MGRHVPAKYFPTTHEIAATQDPPVQELPGILNFARTPPARRRPAAPELENVLTQQTAVLAGMMRRLDEVQARPAAAPGAGLDQLEDPNFNWNGLRVPTTTNFPVPNTGAVQRMASSLLSKLHTLQGRDNHDARFVLQMTSLWPDMDEEDRKFVFQRLNLYAIVASFGWPTAIEACNASSATAADCYLPPGVVPNLPNQRRNRNFPRQQQQQQQQQPIQQQQQQQQPRNNPPANRPHRGRGRNN